jgi:hypothetical protein
MSGELPPFAQGQEALAAADKLSLEELFSRDPLEMAIEDDTKGGRNFERVCEALRRERERHKENENKIALGMKVAKAKAVKAPKAPATRPEDLGL